MTEPVFCQNEEWKNWQRDFRFGTLVFIPPEPFLSKANTLRMRFDPIAAQTSMAHVTLTQPFSQAPSQSDFSQLGEVLRSFKPFMIQIGPATTSPNQKLLWLDVNPKEKVLALREALHETGLFRTDLPLTKGFIPHLTLSEAPRDFEEVNMINNELNCKLEVVEFNFNEIAWIIPDPHFRFQTFQTFKI